MLLLLAVAVTACGRHHHMKKGTGLLVGESEDDVRDNVFNYDEQGGGEEDEACLPVCLFDCLQEDSETLWLQHVVDADWTGGCEGFVD